MAAAYAKFWFSLKCVAVIYFCSDIRIEHKILLPIKWIDNRYLGHFGDVVERHLWKKIHSHIFGSDGVIHRWKFFYFMIIWDHLSGTICKPLGIITWRQQSWLIIYTEACALLSLGKHKRILILPRDMSKCKAPASVVITRWTKMYPDFQEYGRVHLWKKPTCERECRGTVFVNKKTQLFMWIFCSEMTLHNIPKDQFSEFEWISCHRFTNRGSK